jgi:hypothetical protein
MSYSSFQINGVVTSLSSITHACSLCLSMLFKWGRQYVIVGIATHYGLDGPGLEPQ